MKTRRNKPDKLIRNFFPIEEERNFAISVGFVYHKVKILGGYLMEKRIFIPGLK
jgi:hypothetical protein